MKVGWKEAIVLLLVALAMIYFFAFTDGWQQLMGMFTP